MASARRLGLNGMVTTRRRPGVRMKLVAALTTAALVAAAPASLGLIGNAEFSQAIPVRLPAKAKLLDSDGRPVTQHSDASASEESVERSGDQAGDRARGAARAVPGDDLAADDRSDNGSSEDRGSDDRVPSRPKPTDNSGSDDRSEESRVGKECRSRWSPY